jgi:hypothetical protein
MIALAKISVFIAAVIALDTAVASSNNDGPSDVAPADVRVDL